MLIKLDITKSIDENAGDYYNIAKKAKKKAKGIDKALALFEQQRKELIKKRTIALEAERNKIEPQQPHHWYEKFRWFISSEGALCIGGRDATQNEILIKKHLETGDQVLHSEAPGSPFFIVKANKNITEKTYEEAARATLTYSRAWRLGVQSADVYRVGTDQISKTAESGEYLSKGSFMIRGKRTYYRATLGIAVGVKDQQIIAGPLSAVKKHTETYCTIIPDNLKASDAAKQIKKLLNYPGHIDDIIRFLPSGKMKVIEKGKERRA